MAQAEETLDAQADIPVKKSKKKLFVVAGAVLVLLGGAGAGAWHFMGQQADAHEAEAEAEPQKAPVFVRVDTFTVNLQPEDDERYLQIEIVLRVANDEQAELFKLHMPEVRSRLLMLFSSKRASELTQTEGKNKLMGEIIATMNRPFAPKGKPQDVNAVFFTSFIIQ